MQRVDVAATLDPGFGVAREVRIIPPDGPDRPLWTVAVDVGIGDRRDDAAALDITWVGAAGLRQAGTLVRGAGESVERFALSIPGGLRSGETLAAAPRGASWAADAERDDAASYQAVTVTAAGRTMTRVPAAAVDYPPLAELASVDPGPSGTASGLGPEMALRSAAKESIERDAAMRAWYRPDRARRLPTSVVETMSPEIGRVVADLGRSGVEFAFFLLKAVADAQVVLALTLDHGHGVVGAGLGLEPLATQSMVRAAQESLQIRTLLLDLKRVGDPGAATRPIEREIDRARFWAGPEAISTATRWIERAGRAENPPVRTDPVLDWPLLVGDYTFIDLSARLPEPIRKLGWSVVRLFCPTLQPLRMSEAFEWNLKAEGATTDPHPYV